ncbi:VTT domain-containing protein [Niabella pedocola]|uniref:TVP38/TMEM64 family membrane protein n=1 Tax=Niabella pedocola TaxID=1752077 RepID=A0ABS8PLD3_9BACT|nr:VTT domain-containing protein [Niabella pedocola]MCD2421908.1 VTT domain-containing protein [Niabella pedocola]
MHRNINLREQTVRKWVRILWVLLIAGGLLFYLYNRQYFTQEAIAAFLLQYRQQVWLVYFSICILRGLFLLPSTPFLFAGILIFRDSPLLLFGIFMFSILVVAAFIYYAAGYLRFSALSAAPKLQRIQQGLQGKQGFWLILGWAFMPFTPTDLICYAAGLLRIRFWRCMLPLLLGEAVICALYIINGRLMLS